ncbi:MAG: hypothetical protein J2P37_27750, partial [Ktedonobacteraceae bacterium]|nr:hypothetical protein [Ktedonobacteraceae bacterium]
LCSRRSKAQGTSLVYFFTCSAVYHQKCARSYFSENRHYDPDANRIEWLWRISRRVVTHNHQRCTFDLLLADLETHFQTLAHTPADVLRHIGSPFAPDKEAPLPLIHTA